RWRCGCWSRSRRSAARAAHGDKVCRRTLVVKFGCDPLRTPEYTAQTYFIYYSLMKQGCGASRHDVERIISCMKSRRTGNKLIMGKNLRYCINIRSGG